MRLSLRQSSYCHAESIVRLINCTTMDTQVCRVNIEFTINAFQSTSAVGNRPEIRCHSAVNARLTCFAFCLPTKTFHQSITASPGNPRLSFCFVLNVDASERDHKRTKSVGNFKSRNYPGSFVSRISWLWERIKEQRHKGRQRDIRPHVILGLVPRKLRHAGCDWFVKTR